MIESFAAWYLVWFVGVALFATLYRTEKLDIGVIVTIIAFISALLLATGQSP